MIEFVGVVIPQVITTAQTTEPEIITLIGDNGDRENLSVTVYTGDSTTPTPAPREKVFSALAANAVVAVSTPSAEFDFGHSPSFP